jgi:ATP-dependent Zn protease
MLMFSLFFLLAMGGILKTMMRGNDPVPVQASDKHFGDVRGCDEAKAELVEVCSCSNKSIEAGQR